VELNTEKFYGSPPSRMFENILECNNIERLFRLLRNPFHNNFDVLFSISERKNLFFRDEIVEFPLR